MKIGVLAIQGSVIEHINALQKLKVETIEVKLPKDLDEISGLIIPGGESTTIMKLLKRFNTDRKIINLYKKNKLCIYGTCAGAILLAKKITNHPNQPTLGLCDIEIQRNAYGRQIDSFIKKISILGKNIDAVFIRAPIIKDPKKTTVIAQLETPIMIQDNNILITTFHPELTKSLEIHKHFLKMCENIR